jgi:hypothetical protein
LTKFQECWGENRGLQDCTTAFIHQPQPAYLLAVRQTQLIHRIHLPDLVRLMGPPLIVVRTSARWRRR